MTANESATETVWLVAREQSRYWRSVDPKSCEPREGGSILFHLFISHANLFPNRYRRSEFFHTRHVWLPNVWFLFDRSSLRTEILKAHRQHYLYTNYDMMQVPMISPELEERFSSQIMCTYVYLVVSAVSSCWISTRSDMFENKTLVIFVHEL